MQDIALARHMIFPPGIVSPKIRERIEQSITIECGVSWLSFFFGARSSSFYPLSNDLSTLAVDVRCDGMEQGFSIVSNVIDTRFQVLAIGCNSHLDGTHHPMEEERFEPRAAARSCFEESLRPIVPTKSTTPARSRIASMRKVPSLLDGLRPWRLRKRRSSREEDDRFFAMAV